MLQVFGITLITGTVSTTLSHPFEFLKTKIQVYNEGIGIQNKGLALGYNQYRVFTQLHSAGYGTKVLYTGSTNKF